MVSCFDRGTGTCSGRQRAPPIVRARRARAEFAAVSLLLACGENSHALARSLWTRQPATRPGTTSFSEVVPEVVLCCWCHATSTRGERCRYCRDSSTHSTHPWPRSSASGIAVTPPSRECSQDPRATVGRAPEMRRAVALRRRAIAFVFRSAPSSASRFRSGNNHCRTSTFDGCKRRRKVLAGGSDRTSLRLPELTRNSSRIVHRTAPGSSGTCRSRNRRKSIGDGLCHQVDEDVMVSAPAARRSAACPGSSAPSSRRHRRTSDADILESPGGRSRCRMKCRRLSIAGPSHVQVGSSSTASSSITRSIIRPARRASGSGYRARRSPPTAACSGRETSVRDGAFLSRSASRTAARRAS